MRFQGLKGSLPLLPDLIRKVTCKQTKNDTCITNENLLCSTGNSVLCGDLNGKEIPKKRDICLHIIDSLSLQQKLTHHCKATKLQ